MNNDLISRKALRENMEFICMGIMAGTEPYNAPLTEIDNAPTVKQRDNFDLGYIQGLEDGKNEKPQINILCENADEKAIADMKEELQKVIDDLRPQGRADMKNITETPSSCITANPNSVEAYHQSLKGGAENDN